MLRDLPEFLPDPAESSEVDSPRYRRDELYLYWSRMGFTEDEAKKMIADPAYMPEL